MAAGWLGLEREGSSGGGVGAVGEPTPSSDGKHVASGSGHAVGVEANSRQHQRGSTWAPKANPRAREVVVGEGVRVGLVIVPGPRRLAVG